VQQPGRALCCLTVTLLWSAVAVASTVWTVPCMYSCMHVCSTLLHAWLLATCAVVLSRGPLWLLGRMCGRTVGCCTCRGGRQGCLFRRRHVVLTAVSFCVGRRRVGHRRTGHPVACMRAAGVFVWRRGVEAWAAFGAGWSGAVNDLHACAPCFILCIAQACGVYTIMSRCGASLWACWQCTCVPTLVVLSTCCRVVPGTVATT
jgi:hypothetical protein